MGGVRARERISGNVFMLPEYGEKSKGEGEQRGIRGVICEGGTCGGEGNGEGKMWGRSE